MSAANKQVLKLSRCCWDGLSQKQKQELVQRHTVKIITYVDEVSEMEVGQ